MLCPACNSKEFSQVLLSGNLPVLSCKACSGVWVDLDTYRAWRHLVAESPEALFVAEIEMDDDSARFCPKTRRLMERVKVSNEAPFRLDYSAAGQGVWLDRGEWDVLNALGLERQLDMIVSDRWQRQLQTAASRERLDRAQRARFGDAAYGELLRMREWLQEQPNSAEMIAFLSARAD